MVSDALVSFIAKPLSTMVLVVLLKQVLVPHEEGYDHIKHAIIAL